MATPHFRDVPQHWRHPEGPYRQAPAEYGGDWWLVSPFASTEPWVTQSKPPEAVALPDGFAEIFGPRPQAKDYRGPGYPQTFQAAMGEWEQSLKHFKQAGPPPDIPPQMIADAAGVFQAWDMGMPRYYEGRYGWRARFPESAIPSFEGNAWAVVEVPHLFVAQYQIALAAKDIEPRNRHPFVPPQVWGDDPLDPRDPLGMR